MRFSCFTLTMWDVKSVKSNVPDGTFLFYLNYVGCKVWKRYGRDGVRYSFTLTMWDVKIILIGELSTTETVLP